MKMKNKLWLTWIISIITGSLIAYWFSLLVCAAILVFKVSIPISVLLVTLGILVFELSRKIFISWYFKARVATVVNGAKSFQITKECAAVFLFLAIVSCLIATWLYMFKGRPSDDKIEATSDYVYNAVVEDSGNYKLASMASSILYALPARELSIMEYSCNLIRSSLDVANTIKELQIKYGESYGQLLSQEESDSLNEKMDICRELLDNHVEAEVTLYPIGYLLTSIFVLLFLEYRVSKIEAAVHDENTIDDVH